MDLSDNYHSFAFKYKEPDLYATQEAARKKAEAERQAAQQRLEAEYRRTGALAITAYGFKTHNMSNVTPSLVFDATLDNEYTLNYVLGTLQVRVKVKP